MNRYLQTFESIASQHNISWYYYKSKKAGGLSYEDKRLVKCPKPLDIERFAIGLHEIAHILIEFHPRTKSYRKEYECELWALNKIKKLGFSVPQTVINRTKRYVAYSVQEAIHRGLKTLDADVRDFIKDKYPDTAKLKHRYV